MTAWHLAPALVTFREQLNAAFPHRDTRSDGTIGDLRHQHEAGGSDHNPDSTGTVCAFDGTHGPYWHLSLADANLIANQLVASRDPRINYVIFNSRIWTKARGWHDYPVPPNASPHREHFHLSVFHGNLANDGSEWNLPAFHGTPVVSVIDLVQGQTDSQPAEPAQIPLLTTTPLDTQDDEDMASYARNTQTGAMIKYTALGFTLLNPDQVALEQGFGAVFAELDATTFDRVVSQRDQTHVSLQNGSRLDGRTQ